MLRKPLGAIVLLFVLLTGCSAAESTEAEYTEAMGQLAFDFDVETQSLGEGIKYGAEILDLEVVKNVGGLSADNFDDMIKRAKRLDPPSSLSVDDQHANFIIVLEKMKQYAKGVEKIKSLHDLTLDSNLQEPLAYANGLVRTLPYFNYPYLWKAE